MDRLSDKKILFVITKSNWGGAQQYVYTLATRFREAGADVFVALGGTGDAGASAGLLEKRLRDADVGTIFLSSFARDIAVLRDIAAFFELWRVIRKEKPEILHLNSSKAGGLGALAGRMAGVPKIIYTAHGWAHGESRPIYQRASIWIASWLTAQLCHAVIAISNADVRRAPVLFSRKKILLIYNGISTFPLLDTVTARERIGSYAPGALRYSFWFLSLSELHPNKGIDTLIRAFAGVARQNATSALILINDGQSRRELEDLVQSLRIGSRVFFAGFVPDARELLHAADAFVLSSRKEGLPFVLLEAGLARLPVIASRVGAVPEIIGHETSGLLVSPHDTEGLTSALLTLLTEDSLRERMGNALHAKIVRDFSEEEMLVKTADAYAA